MGHQSTGTLKGAASDSALQRCEANLRVMCYSSRVRSMLTIFKTLIERFANFTSADDLFESINQVYRDADHDPELKGWFRNMNTYIRKCLREQGYVLRDESTQEWNQLHDKGDFLLRDRYKDHVDHLIDEVKFLADQFDEDPQNRAFGDAMQKMFLDLGQDENGNPAFKPHLIKDLTEVIVPGIFENSRYVPIPRIEYSDPMIDMVVENLVVESDNLFPNALEFGSDNYWRMGRKSIKSHRENKVMIAASGVQMDLRDVAYYMKKKQGFPSITDKGVMDILMGGDGFAFKIAARNAHKGSDRTHFLVIDKIDVQINNLDIKVKQSNHKLLFKLAKSLVLKVMKPAITKAIEKIIKDKFEQADGFAYSIYSEVEKGKETAKRDPEEAANMYQRYMNAFQKKMAAKREKGDKAKKNTQTNIALDMKSSIFPHISLPGGISTKATEYRDLAAKGNRWESPVFGIGSARESSNLPHASKVTRKPHQSRTARLRDESERTHRTGRGGQHGQSQQGYGQQGGQQGYGQQGYDGTGSGYGTGQGTGGRGSEYGTGYGAGNTGAGYPTSSEYSTGYPQTGAGQYGSGYPQTGTGMGTGMSSTTGSGYPQTGTGMGTGMPGTTGSEYGTGYGSGMSGAPTGTMAPGQSYDIGSTGAGVPGSQMLGGQPTTGTSGAASGLNREMDQAFSTGQTGATGTTGNTAPNTSFYNTATR